MTSRERGARVLMMLLMFLGSVLVVPAHADTKDDLQRARTRLDDARAAADAAAARYEAALASHAQLEQDLSKTQERITVAARGEAALERTVQAIAARAYVNAGEPAVGVFLSGDDVLDLARSTRLLDRANAPNLQAIGELDAVRGDLERDREQLAAAKTEARALLATLDAESDRVQDELLVADRTRLELESRDAQEQQVRYLAAARQAQELARAQTTTTIARTRPSGTTTTRPIQAPNTTSTTRPGTPSAPPASGSIVCPIRGAVSFVDSWGAPRSGGRKHEGVDMMSAPGTPNVAVVSGTVTQRSGAVSGVGVYLAGDDGNSYWYFHLSAYEGSPRHVAQGDVVGYTGSTGNADGGAPHTHFEYHPGGGGPVNPYPLVRPAC